VLKLSEQSAKVSNPGVLQVRRFRGDAGFIADAIYNEPTGVGDGEPTTVVDPADMTRRKTVPAGTPHEDLLAAVFRGGSLVYDMPPLEDVRRRAAEQLAGFHASIKRFVHPHSYPAGLERRLHELKTDLVLRARGFAAETGGGSARRH
jgi:nicotinate phosphoribosyltransferase